MKMAKSNEIQLIRQYMLAAMKGDGAERPEAKSGEAKQLLEKVDQVLQFQKMAIEEARAVMGISGDISNFDVEMSYMSDYLADFAGKLAELSQSNLAVVQETTSTMGHVRENVGYTSARLKKLSQESGELSKKNNEGRKLLQDVEYLKQDVVQDMDQMKGQIMELVELVQEIEGIVDSVQGIATQTNLLALNASIEAARAGEQGRGFAVVAEEVGKLAENTQKELNAMKEFVTRIYEASRAGQSSTEKASRSTEEMSGKIDTVFSTVGENINMLEQVAVDVSAIDEYMQKVEQATDDVNAAMQQCSQDAEEITYLTVTVSELADDSRSVAEQMEKIDSRITESTNNIYTGLDLGISMLTNKELIDVLGRARTAHENWANKVRAMIDKKKVDPLQLDPNKCAFGHFYNAIRVRHPKLSELWAELGEKHRMYHTQGRDVLSAVDAGDIATAEKRYEKTKELSREIEALIANMIEAVEDMTAQGEAVF